MCENACGKLPTSRFELRVVLLREQAERRCAARAAARTSRSLRRARPASTRLSTNQNEQRKNAPSPGGSPSTRTPSRRGGSAARSRRRAVRGARPRACRARADRRRQEPESGIVSRLASTRLRAVVLDERAQLLVAALLEHLGRGSRRGTRRQRSAAPLRPNCSTALTPRSNATHAITFEWTKWRRGPRTSQIPSSGSRQRRSRFASSTLLQGPRLVVRLDVLPTCLVERRPSPRRRRRAGTARWRRCRPAPAATSRSRRARAARIRAAAALPPGRT